VIMPEDEEQFAIPMNGKKRNIRKNDFLRFAEQCNISRKSAEKMMANLIQKKDKFIEMCKESYLPPHMKDSLIKLIEERIENLG
jgi:serine/threonine-protein kinase HipA